jgi:hypothetical protein
MLRALGCEGGGPIIPYAMTALSSPTPTSSSSSSSQTVYVVPPAGRSIASGFAADFYQTNEHHVIKRPKFFPGYHTENQTSRGLVDNERKVYERFGSHKGIIEYYGISDV